MSEEDPQMEETIGEVETPRPSLIKPTLDTLFHIDFSWWRQNDRDWRVFLRGLLGEDMEAKLTDINIEDRVDWVDPQTGEVSQMDVLQFLLSTHYAQQGEEEGGGTSLIESIFRTFLRNGNRPLSSRQLGEALGRPGQTILRTLAGARVYRGIRTVGA